LVGGFVPNEGLGIFVVALDDAASGLFSVLCGAMDAAAELLFDQQSGPAFDQVKPTG
jgi:hypothetical protein